MISEINKSFKRQYYKTGEALIIDNYVLAFGEYATFTLEDTAESIKFYSVNKNTDSEEDAYRKFAELDYMSGLISMNKPVDPDKIIHSNNVYSFFVKKENLDAEKGKLKSETIDNYYSILKAPQTKYKDKKKLELYLNAEKIYGEVDKELADKINTWMKENIFKLVDKLKLDKTYLKLFFDADIEEYERESQKYILPNIYNSNEYNVKIGDKLYGLPDFNMGLNAKKPYLENKTRKSKLPVLVDSENIIQQKKLFSCLMNYSAQGKNYVYAAKELEGVSQGEHRNKNFQGSFVRVNKGKEVEIVDFDIITSYRYELKRSVKVLTILDNSVDKNFLLLKKEFTNLHELKEMISEVYFNKFLSRNFFTEPKDIKLEDSRVKEALLKYRYGFYTWFYKGEESLVRRFWNKMSKDLMINSVIGGNVNKAVNQFNLRHALLHYFDSEKGGKSMADNIRELKISLNEKINLKKDPEFKIAPKDSEEYYFCIGQLLQFFYGLNKSGSKSHAFIRPIINAKNDGFVKEQLRKLYMKYSYAIRDFLRFNNMYFMVSAYEAEGEVNQDMIIAGFLSLSLIYMKSDNSDEKLGGNEHE